MPIVFALQAGASCTHTYASTYVDRPLSHLVVREGGRNRAAPQWCAKPGPVSGCASADSLFSIASYGSSLSCYSIPWKFGGYPLSARQDPLTAGSLPCSLRKGSRIERALPPQDPMIHSSLRRGGGSRSRVSRRIAGWQMGRRATYNPCRSLCARKPGGRDLPRFLGLRARSQRIRLRDRAWSTSRSCPSSHGDSQTGLSSTCNGRGGGRAGLPRGDGRSVAGRTCTLRLYNSSYTPLRQRISRLRHGHSLVISPLSTLSIIGSVTDNDWAGF